MARRTSTTRRTSGRSASSSASACRVRSRWTATTLGSASRCCPRAASCRSRRSRPSSQRTSRPWSIGCLPGSGRRGCGGSRGRVSANTSAARERLLPASTHQNPRLRLALTFPRRGAFVRGIAGQAADRFDRSLQRAVCPTRPSARWLRPLLLVRRARGALLPAERLRRGLHGGGCRRRRRVFLGLRLVRLRLVRTRSGSSAGRTGLLFGPRRDPQLPQGGVDLLLRLDHRGWLTGCGLGRGRVAGRRLCAPTHPDRKQSERCQRPRSTHDSG